jgi:hypothetical protein
MLYAAADQAAEPPDLHGFLIVQDHECLIGRAALGRVRGGHAMRFTIGFGVFGAAAGLLMTIGAAASRGPRSLTVK